LVGNHEQTGAVAPSENGRLPPVLAHQLASARKPLTTGTLTPLSAPTNWTRSRNRVTLRSKLSPIY